MTLATESQNQIDEATARFVDVVLDAAQWLRFSAVHTWRHRTQVVTLRRTAGA